MSEKRDLSGYRLAPLSAQQPVFEQVKGLSALDTIGLSFSRNPETEKKDDWYHVFVVMRPSGWNPQSAIDRPNGALKPSSGKTFRLSYGIGIYCAVKLASAYNARSMRGRWSTWAVVFEEPDSKRWMTFANDVNDRQCAVHLHVCEIGTPTVHLNVAPFFPGEELAERGADAVGQALLAHCNEAIAEFMAAWKKAERKTRRAKPKRSAA